MRCSLIIPSYLRPQSLQRCLLSALAQTRPPDELIVVTRVGDEASEQVVAGLRETASASGIALIHARVRPPGLVNAQNAGLAEATGDIVSFTDDDVALPPDWLARVQKHFADESIGAVGGRDRLMYDPPLDEPAQVVGRLAWYGRMTGNHHLVLPGGPREVDHLKGCNMSYRRRLSPRLDPNLIGVDGTELDLCLRIREAGFRVIYDPALVVEHYPAPRPNLPQRMTPVTSLQSAHNLAYTLWRRLPWWRRVVFLAYMLAIGQGDCYGLVKLLVQARRDGLRLAWRKFSGSVRGTLRGVARAAGARGRGPAERSV
jgi:cellulose synthase/poly-beta-1,6-N-acetylglucosamine synthase-like glycosyltransferase